MEFRTTSIDAAGRRARGFTLPEMMVASAIMSILLTILAGFALFTGRSFAAMSNYTELEQQSRIALDRLSREIRQSRGIIELSETSVVVRDDEGEPVEFSYDSASRTLLRIKGDEKETLLTECDEVSFEYFQRTPVGATYEIYPAQTPATAKMVQVTWLCSRPILGNKANTESVQSAKIVIRKRN